MSSGIVVTDVCSDAYAALSKRQYSAIVLAVNEHCTETCIEKKHPATSGDPETEWKEFSKSLPETDCRFIVADFSWKDSPTVTKSKICMILWSPNDAPIRSKTIYATTQEAVANKMEVQRFIQANDIDDLDYDSIKSSVSK